MLSIEQIKEELRSHLNKSNSWDLSNVDLSKDPFLKTLVDRANKIQLSSLGVSSISELSCPICKKQLEEDTVARNQLLLYSPSTDKPWCKKCADRHDSIEW